jgi:Zn-dependent peptidase ImmA (M78 family)/transcriptional regulator with XRE-family HTH domain
VETAEFPLPGIPLPLRIRAARDLRGLTQSEVVVQMSSAITSAALSQIEAGKVRPTGDTLRQLAGVLEVPIEFFIAHWPGGLPDDEMPTAFFRDLRATPVRERRRALALALLLSDLVTAVGHRVRLPAPDIPQHAIEPTARREDIERAAERVRSHWDLGDGPVPHVIREIERHGVPVTRLVMGHRSVDAFSVVFEGRPIVLLTDDKSNYVRSRFDAAHELGHLVMHTGRTDTGRVIETQAHTFASTFLLPRSVAIEELPRRLDAEGWRRLAELKRRWGISMSALLKRGRDLRTLTDSDYRNAMKYMSSRGWRTFEPGDREMGPPESPLLLERALRTIEIQDDLTVEEIIESAHLPIEDTLQLVRASHDKRPIIEL